MSGYAVASKPWRRWARYHRRRQTNRPNGGAVKPWNGIVTGLTMIAALVCLDQLLKYVFITPDWAWHYQPPSWRLIPLIAIAIFVPLLPFRQTRLTASLFIGGAIGNLLSSFDSDGIANPFLVQYGTSHIAFNAADVFLIGGLVSGVWACWLVAVAINERLNP